MVNEASHCVKVEEISAVKKRFSFDIPWPDVREELDSAYRIVGKKARIKGFRPGRTPRKVLETYYKDEAESDAISRIVNRVYWSAVEEAKVIPVAQPVIDQKGIEKDKNFEFTATVEIKPSIEPRDYLDLEIEKEEVEISEDDVQRRLEDLRQAYSTLEDPKEDRSIREGDLATIDFEGRLDGVSLKELKADQYPLEIGSKRFVPGFEEQMKGMKTGESKDIQVRFPDDYHSKDLAGKDVVFSVTVKGIKEKILPALDEHFVKNFEKYETLDEIRAEIRKGLKAETEARIRESVVKYMVDKLMEKNPMDVPDAFVERQIYSLMLDAQRRMAMNGMDPKKAAEIAARMHDTLKGEAERMVKTSLLLESIADKESIQVEETDLEEKMRALAERFGQTVDEVKKFYGKDDMIEALRNEIREEKTLDFIEAKAKIKFVKK
jgi:trigger factor